MTRMYRLTTLQRPCCLPIGKELTGGLGASGIQEIGEKAAQESKEESDGRLKMDMVFITRDGRRAREQVQPDRRRAFQSMNIYRRGSDHSLRVRRKKKRPLLRRNQKLETTLIRSSFRTNTCSGRGEQHSDEQAFLMADGLVHGSAGISERLPTESTSTSRTSERS